SAARCLGDYRICLHVLAAPADQAKAGESSAEDREASWLRNPGARCGNVHWTRQAATLRLSGAAEDVGNEEVAVGIRGLQLRKRRIGDGKMEIIDVRSGSPVAARSERAFDRGGEVPGAVGVDRR